MRLFSWTAFALVGGLGCDRSPGNADKPPVTDGGNVSPVAKPELGHSFTDPRGRCSVTFPMVPELRPPPSEYTGKPDSPVQLAIWVATLGDTGYILSITYAPSEFLDANYDLDQHAGGESKLPGWKVVKRRDVVVDGQPGKQVEYAMLDGTRSSVGVFARYKGTTVMMSVNGGPGLTGASKETKGFFESFRFLR